MPDDSSAAPSSTGPPSGARSVNRRRRPTRPIGTRDLQAYPVLVQAGQHGRNRAQGCVLADIQGAVERVGHVGRAVREESVDDQVGGRDARLGELGRGAGGLGQRRGLGAGDQHDPGQRRVSQSRNRDGVRGAVLVQPRQGTQARSIALPRCQERGPGARQLQQSDGVTGGRRVEHDVVEAFDHLRIRQVGRELVEGRDLGGAGTRQLFPRGGQLRFRQLPGQRREDPLPVVHGRLLGVDLDRRQANDPGDRSEPMTDPGGEDLGEVGGRVGTDQQHPLPLVGQVHRGRARDRGLADPALAGEEQELRAVSQELWCAHDDQAPPSRHGKHPPPAPLLSSAPPCLHTWPPR